ncbi:MAG TPA: hypothetical protein VH143_24860 [Kofleriaceae bacterium]|jgi:hypothetical protein|nr:hypothetical protein [Kofleriaceae bacterium]
MTPVLIVVMVVGIVVVVAGVNLAIWLPLRGRLAKLPQQLGDELVAAGETIVQAPARGAYRGSTGGGAQVIGTAVLALTTRLIACKKLMGSRVDVPLAQIVGIREDHRFRNRYVGNRLHLIVQLESGVEVAFFVADHDAWKAALREQTGKPLEARAR